MILSDTFNTPFDENRKGLNLGEGAAYLVLESEKSYKKRNKQPIAYISGYANANDAFHQTASSENGEGAFLAMKKAFDIADVCHSLCEKLINRHPHIYGDVKVKDEAEVKRNWEKLKLKEGNKSVLSGVPKSLPALVKANRIQDKAAGVGFDWEKPEQVFEKLQEELGEFQDEVRAQNQEKMEAEFGDVLFSMINYARFLNIDPENALERTNKKFINRFQFLEKKIQENGKDFKNLSLEEMDVFWNEAKLFEYKS
jgi:MazG family protein